MRKALIVTGIAVICSAAKAQHIWNPATDIAMWTFEASTPGGSSGTSNGPYSPEFGSGSAIGQHTLSGTNWSSPVGNGSAESWSSTHWSAGDYYQFKTSTIGWTNIEISWDQTRSNTGPADFALQYSTDGVNFTEYLTYNVGALTWSSGSYAASSNYGFSFSTWLDNQASVYFRLTSRQTTATGGTNRVDNFVVSGTPGAVPEPVTMGLGIAGAGVFVRKRLKTRRA